MHNRKNKRASVGDNRTKEVPVESIDETLDDDDVPETITQASSSKRFLFFTILIIMLGMMCGSLTRTVYKAAFVADPTIPNSDLVPFNVKIMDLLYKSSRIGSWNTIRSIRNLLSMLTYKEPVLQVQDLQLHVPIRMYYPNGDDNLPIIMYFHGGGWTVGSLDTHDSTCRHLANTAQSIVISVDYRLAPENPFPAGFEDCYEVTRWAHQNAASFRGDPKRMVVMGDSAGANLAAAIAVENHNRTSRDFQLAAQVLLYPMTNLLDFNTTSMREYRNAYILSQAGTAKFVELYLNDTQKAKDYRASPYLYDGDLQGLPQTLVVTASFDPLKDDGRSYFDKLVKGGVNAKWVEYQDVHGFFAFFGSFASTEVGKRAIDEVAAHLRSVFLVE